MNITSAVKTAKTLITANSPVLLVGTAIAGVVATGVLAAKGGYKARGLVDEAEREKVDPLTAQEKVQLTWKCYAIPALTGASTIASCVGVHTIHTKRHAALAGLYAVTSTKLDDYTEKAEELLGPKRTQDTSNHVSQKRLDENPIESKEVLITGRGTELCHDDLSGRYFEGSMAILENAINEINRKLVEDGDASLNEFYDLINLPPIPWGETFGWSGEKIRAAFGAVKASDGRAAINIWFETPPKANAGRF